MGRTKVGVIGVGSLGEHHARIYAQLPEADLVAVVDVDRDRAQQIATDYGCAAYRDYQDVLDLVEAVSIAVPTSAHARIGAEFLAHGRHVLVEKPIAQDLAGADRLIEAARRSDRVLMVGHSERFNPAFLAVRSLIQQPKFFEAHRLGIFVPRGLDVDVVLDLMIHDLDLILHLVDSPLAEVRGVGIPVITTRVDIANARLEFHNGCVANVTASRVSKEKIRKLRLFQAHDYISIDFHGRTVEMFSLLRQGAKYQVQEREFAITEESPLRLEVAEFLSQVRGEETPPGAPSGCSGAQGKQALELALGVLDAIHTRAPEGLERQLPGTDTEAFGGN